MLIQTTSGLHEVASQTLDAAQVILVNFAVCGENLPPLYAIQTCRISSATTRPHFGPSALFTFR